MFDNTKAVSDEAFDMGTPIGQIPQPTAPSALPAQTVSVMPTPAPLPRRSHKGRWIALLVVVLLLAAAAGAYYYFMVFSLTPEKVMAKMFVAMSDVSSGTADVTVEGKGTGVPQSSLFVPEGEDGKGPVDTSLLVHLLVNIDEPNQLFGGEFSFTASADNNAVVAFGGEMRSVDDTDYVQFTKLEASIIPKPFQPAIDSVLNEWVSFDTKTIKNTLHLTPVGKEIDSAAEDAQAQQAAIVAAFKQHLPLMIAITGTLPSETVDGVGTWHYAFAVDKNAVGDFLEEVSTITSSKLDVTKMREALGASDDVTGEVWIAKTDFRVRKLTAATTVKGQQRLSLTSTILLSDYNTPKDIIAPEGATPFQQVLTSVLQVVAENSSADDDNDGLTNSQERRYKTDPNNPDSDGDGYTDGDEVKNGYNPTGEGLLPKIEIKFAE